MQKKIQEIFFDFEIKVFELGALNTRFYWERILVIGCHCLKKKSQDLKYYWKNFLEQISFGSDQKIWQI